jgi:starvation-inducible DNA-binding protein
MNDLAQQMKVVLASTFAFYLKAHNFHWNVEGSDFQEYHAFFGDLYAELWGAVDGIAEGIRTLDVYAPGSLSRFTQLSVVDDQINIPSAKAMVSELRSDNTKLLAELAKAYRLAEDANKLGVSNFLQDRLTAHDKHAWMLRAMSK